MNSRFPSLLRLAGTTAFCLAIISCGDDPALVSKREQQKAEIKKLEGELAILQERMGQLPKDRSEEIAELKKETADNQAEIVELEDQIQTLEREKAAIERDHESYRRKYVVR